MVIQPKTGLFEVNLKELWQYRDLMLLFVRRDFVAQYKQTVLGPVWHVIQPIFTTVIYVMLFGKIANIPTDRISPVLFYMSGITIWNYFQLCLTSTSNSFVGNASIFGKVYFPRLIIPISVAISTMIRFGIQFALLLIVIIWYSFLGYPVLFTWNWLMIPVFVLMLAFMALGLGIIISSVTTKYRDFTVLLAFSIQLAMYATPIAYPSSFLAHRKYYWIVQYNPLAPIIEGFRYALFGKGSFTYASLWYSAAFMVLVLFSGILLFNKVEKTFMDTV